MAPGDSVLDIATGTGIPALRAAKQAGLNGDVLGVDVSSGMIAEARRKAAEADLRTVVFRVADAERLDQPAGRFDRIFCASALVMLRDAGTALRRWSRLLKPGGTIASTRRRGRSASSPRSRRGTGSISPTRGSATRTSAAAT